MPNKVNFDDYTNNYDELLRESTSFFSSNEKYFSKYKVEILKRSLSDPRRVKTILEFGCGIGRNIEYIQELFPDAKIVGTDISTESIKIAAENNPKVRFEVESDSLKLGQFDVIFIAGVFHHIHPNSRESVLRTINERLAPGGTLIIFEHNPFNPVTRNIVNNCPYDADAILIKPSELKNLLRTNGLVIKKTSYCLFIPPKLSFLSSIESYLGWLPLGGQYFITARK